MRLWMILGATSVMLGACMTPAPSHWQHKSIPSDQWRSDQKRCERAVDRHLGLFEKYHADRDISEYDERMRVYEVRKKQAELVGECMRKLGYVPRG